MGEALDRAAHRAWSPEETPSTASPPAPDEAMWNVGSQLPPPLELRNDLPTAPVDLASASPFAEVDWSGFPEPEPGVIDDEKFRPTVCERLRPG